MADDYWSLDAELAQSLVEQLSLLGGGPQVPARAFAVAEAGAIEDDHAMASQQELSNPAGVPVVSTHRVAMDQHDRAALAPIAVMQPHAIHLHEGALRRVPALSRAGCKVVAKRKRGQSRRTREDGCCTGGEGLGSREEGHGCPLCACARSGSA